MRASWLSLILLIAPLPVIGCKKSPIEVSRTSYVIGPSDDIEKLADELVDQAVELIARASVLIVTRLSTGVVKFCSGTIIDPQEGEASYQVVTNYHCFAQLDSKTNLASRELLPEACDKTFVVFGFSGLTEYATTKLECKRGTLRTHFLADLATFKLDGPLPMGAQSLEFWPEDEVPKNRQALIVHHPDISTHHRVLEGTQIPLPSAAVTRKNCIVNGKFTAEEESLDPILALGIRHTCDLISGSSGSALVDAESQTVLGVNWGGIKLISKCGEQMDNVATEAYFVRAFLENEDLVELASQRPRPLDEQQCASSQLAKKSNGGGILGTSFSCGVISVRSSSSLFALFLLFGLPILVSMIDHRRRRF